MGKAEQTSQTYDAMFRDGGYEGAFDLPYRHSTYYPMFHAVLGELRRHPARRVLEVGCGSGAFARLLLERTSLVYHGIDFSPVAVGKAGARTGRPELFRVGDALDAASYAWEHDAIVCTEVLEHIEQDQAAIGLWRRGTLCVCSVPDYDAETHVRFFRSEAEVRARYGGLIDIATVRQVRKPYLSDISWRNRLRELRWNRHRPRRLRQILGLAPEADYGHWFVFTGRKA